MCSVKVQLKEALMINREKEYLQLERKVGT